MRAPVLALALACLLAATSLGLSPDPAAAMASHVGWPPYEMLLMNKTDSSRPLDARPGMDPFGGRDRTYSCDELGAAPSRSCRPQFVPRGDGFVMTPNPASHRLLGGHGSDTIHAGPWGDVIWGDYKPCCQPTGQRDRLYGGAGPDFIYPSHGHNVVRAGAGMDVIHGHFGRGLIDCGPGRDVVYVHGGHRHAYKVRNCEVVSTATGRSAPRWYLRRLPWRTCPAGTTYRFAACRTAGDHPERDISGVDLTAPLDAARMAARWASQACRLTTQKLPGEAAAALDAVATLRAVVPTLDLVSSCGGLASASPVVEHFDFQGFLAGYASRVCAAGGSGYRPAAQAIADDLADRWGRAIRLRGLTDVQQAVVRDRIAASAHLC